MDPDRGDRDRPTVLAYGAGVDARWTRVLVALALVGTLAACQADATVTVRMNDDGSGTVSVRVVLDAAAVRAAEVGGGTLADRVRLTDLTGAGWTVTPWRGVASGGAVLAVRKPFARPQQVGAIVRELNGAKGPVPVLTASRDASTFSTSWRVVGGIDLRKLDLGLADDQQLVANLTDERVDPSGVEQRILASAQSGLRVTVRAELPDGTARQVSAVPGRRAALVATAEASDLGRQLLVIAGIVVGVLALVLLVLGETRSRRRRARRSVRSRP
jgi:hypothetical protein